MKKFTVALLILALAAFIGTYAYYRVLPLRPSVTIRGQKFYVDLAVTPQERAQGLSGRDALATDEGMLFLFDSTGHHGFWMKDMLFPLDFVWILDFTVADITTNVPIPSIGQQPVSILPGTPVNKVLELPAGTVERTGIAIGDLVTFSD